VPLQRDCPRQRTLEAVGRPPQRYTTSCMTSCVENIGRSQPFGGILLLSSKTALAHVQGRHMAQRVQVILVDDLNGGEATETVEFALDGVTYEVDLSDTNAAKLRDDLAQWIGVARRSGGRRQTRRASRGGG